MSSTSWFWSSSSLHSSHGHKREVCRNTRNRAGPPNSCQDQLQLSCYTSSIKFCRRHRRLFGQFQFLIPLSIWPIGLCKSIILVKSIISLRRRIIIFISVEKLYFCSTSNFIPIYTTHPTELFEQHSFPFDKHDNNGGDDDDDHDDNYDGDAYLIFVIFFTQPQFEAWQFYTWKCVKSRQKLPRDKTA